ncbi:hypothetical protein FOC46_15915 [Citrobacter portucalensis]|nr:hypothetical protein HMPREF9428_04184 [Citrobacter portucalensis]MCH2697990.1 hypothetical protein [Citrobacter portucalensis]QGS14907.1 hypothetical protein FOC46_15915 [Citrobacter portucalensis]
MKHNGLNNPIEHKHHKGSRLKKVNMTVAMKPEKESQRKDRTVRISKEIYVYLPDDKKDRVFSDCYSTFRPAQERTGIERPAGQLGYVLRHTSASQFMTNCDNIMALQEIIVRSDIKMTMRYAPFSPDHFPNLLSYRTKILLLKSLHFSNQNVNKTLI